ncbi:MAG: N-acetyltransferase [Methanophagales archaeon ANME-1-THS]|nr:MAG: N-acetyltransferase [Methanophagales archaeon ANME-1-THS]
MIRKFKRSDLGAILRIEEHAFPKAPYNRVTFLYYASICPTSFLVYQGGGKNGREITGYIIFYPGGHIVSIAVHPAYRRRGIGTRLVEEVLKRTKGVAIVEVRESNEVAIQFYTHLSFVRQTIIPRYYGDEDAVVMVRRGSDTGRHWNVLATLTR